MFGDSPIKIRHSEMHSSARSIPNSGGVNMAMFVGYRARLL
jgi:hypothetical protein